MTIRDVINDLKKRGYNVSFYVRKDGGVRITRINGKTYTGSAGNIEARRIVGTTLSERRARQLSKLKTPKGKGSYNKRRKSKLDEEVVKRIQRLQRLARKKDKGRERPMGIPSIRNYRWVLEHYGKAEADRLLRQSELYTRGIAYDENINALIGRLQSNLDKLDKGKGEVQKVIDRLESMKGVLKESTLSKILDTAGCLYQWEMGTISTEEFVRQINAILDKN